MALPQHIMATAQTDLSPASTASTATKDWIRTWILPRTFADLITARFYNDYRIAGQPPDAAKSSAATAASAITPLVMWQLIPPELLAGLKMNLNRPFGNGRDDNGNNVVDESAALPASEVPESVSLYRTPTAQVPATVSYDPTGGNLAATPLVARQLQARYLYVLATLVTDLGGLKAELTTWRSAQWLPAATGDDVARYLAQWAINVVNFHSRGWIMTPFDYDPNFAWNDPTNHAITGWNPPGDALHRVWGCKRPELLITETLAFHDRRTEDLLDDDSGLSNHNIAGGDATFDQSYRPQGSLFVELYNPSSPFDPPTGEFYNLWDAVNNKWVLTSQLNLTATTPPPATGKPWPVWRLVITIPTASPDGKFCEQLDPDDPVPAQQPVVEREVYFVEQEHRKLPGHSARTARRGGGPILPTNPAVTTIAPGGYAVIGSAEKLTSGVPTPLRTYIGFKVGQTLSTPPAASTRCIDLSTGPTITTLPVLNNNNLPASPSVATRVVLPAVLAIDNPVRLSVSEPVYGYGTLAAINYETRGDYNPATGKYGLAYDVPFDSLRPDGGSVFKYNGTIPRYRMIHLQRLANPLVPFDAVNNPYRTIDTMPVNVTAFNGVFNDSDPTLSTSPPYTPDPQGNSSPYTTHFESRQRGEYNDVVAPTLVPAPQWLNTYMNLWKQEPTDKSNWMAGSYLPANLNTGPFGGNPHYFNKGLKNSLGYLNQPFSTPQDMTYGAMYKGLAATPFPWLTWSGRPYVNALELLMVPALSSSKLLVNPGDPLAPGYPTTDPPDMSNPHYYGAGFRMVNGAVPPLLLPYTATSLIGPNVPYPHLLNFFQSSNTVGASTQFHRLLDYVGVPSPFACADIQADPTASQGNIGAHAFHPPFNWISTYREPGRINLNTIYSPQVFAGLMNGYAAPSWATFVPSRRNDGRLNVLDMPNTDTPTEFARPFRSAAGGQMVPTLASDVLRPNPEVNATLLRADSTGTTPLFQYNRANNVAPSVDNSNLNPFFRYQGLERLGNLVTTRSNVYAVWITVGYFEVTPLATGYNPAIYPDGYELGRELGLDTGDVQRHRAFYIIDRSIPVGFQRGQDLNAEKAILLNRYIE